MDEQVRALIESVFRVGDGDPRQRGSDMENAIDRLPAVLQAKGLKRSAHYEEVKAGLWTEGVSLGARAKGWPRRETELLLAARIAGKTPEEIRQLVRALHAARRLAV
jgi:prophage regulatory protein